MNTEDLLKRRANFRRYYETDLHDHEAVLFALVLVRAGADKSRHS